MITKLTKNNKLYTKKINEIIDNLGSGGGDADTVDGYHAGNDEGEVAVNNGTLNTNLNADKLDGYHAGNTSGSIPINNGTVNTNLNADMLDGNHFTDIINAVYPVGSYYIQFPDANSNDINTAFPSSRAPATLFGGTWTKVFDTEGIFFRTEGDPYGEGQNHLRTNGEQLDTTQSHRHVSGTMRIWDAITGLYGDISNAVENIRYPVARYTGSLTNADLDYTSGLVQETGGSPRTGYETRPLNRLIRVWKRTA